MTALRQLLPRLSLRARGVLLAGLALAIVLLADAALREKGLEDAGRRSLAERAALLVSIQGAALSVPMWNLDRDQVGAALDALAADPDFVGACVVQPDGSTLERRIASASRFDRARIASTIEVTRAITYRSHGETRTLGTLYLRLSTLRLAAQLRGEWQAEAGSLVFLLCLVLLIVLVTLRQFTRPLDLLADTLTRLAAGDREVPIPASDRQDEVGAVARGLEVFRDTAFRLVQAEGTYRALFDNAPLGIFGHDADGNTHSINAAALRISGYAEPAELQAALRRTDDTGFYVDPERRVALYTMLHGIGHFSGETAEIRRADGTTLWTSMTCGAVYDETGGVLGFAGTMEDISETMRRQGEERLRVRAAMECASDAILIVDADGATLFANAAFERCFGYGRGGLAEAGGLPAVLVDAANAAALAQAFRNGEPWQEEADVLARDGRVLPLLIRVSTIRDDQGAGFGSVVICTDLTDRRQAEARIQHMAHYDWLTGLPNRVFFRERLNAALAHAAHEGRGFAVLCLDLDRFKAVNDTHGHPAGDRLLQLAAARLQGVVREGDTVARVGGDEFTLIQLGISQPDQALLLAERLIQALAEPFDLDGREAQIGASIGVSLAPLHGTDPDRLLGFADVALYEAKSQGKRQARVFTPDMDRMLRKRTELEQDLRRAVAEKRLHLHFQPQYLLATETLVGAEALLRWTDPQRGVVTPNEFIPVAEESGLILAIGHLVLETACREAVAWPQALSVAVNVSPVQFHSGDLIGTVRGILAETGLPASRLELEITEGVLLHDTEATRATLLGLKSLGVRITLDDFGTGYSSLSYLRRMPFDKIKIDRSFVSALGQDPAAGALVRSIIGLAKGLGLQTNAEGVETKLQARLLREEGCQEVQGYYYSHPISAAAFADLQDPRPFAKSA